MKTFIKSGGFTLIETLVALLILAFALLALAGLMATTTRNNSFGGRMTEAATFAQSKLEELQAMPTDSILSGNDQTKGSGTPGIQYVRSWNVVTTTNLDEKWVKKDITLTINWTDTYNRSITVVSVIRRPLT